MENQVFRTEQMRSLIKKGVDTSNAKLYWCINKSNPVGRKKDLMKPFLSFYKVNQVVGLQSFEYLPTFTFFDAVKLLPKVIRKGEDTFFLSLLYDISDGVVITYSTEHIKKILHSTGSSNQIDALFEMIEWCKENKHI